LSAMDCHSPPFLLTPLSTELALAGPDLDVARALLDQKDENDAMSGVNKRNQRPSTPIHQPASATNHSRR